MVVQTGIMVVHKVIRGLENLIWQAHTWIQYLKKVTKYVQNGGLGGIR